jgi:hypothetical protein
MNATGILGSGLFLIGAGVLGLACASSDDVTANGGGATTATTATATTTTPSGVGGAGGDTGSGGAGGATGVGGAGGMGGGAETGICLLHNCAKDAECSTCSEGRHTCDLASKRCVACDAKKPCPAGQECSSAGTCVQKGQTCPTDGAGNPTIKCKTSADCAACDPMHQVCDAATSACVACTAQDSSACQSTDLCANDKCLPKCPKSCDHDDQCAFCGTQDAPAHACNAHKCSECSPTYACKAGFECDPHGVCIAICGIDGLAKGTCDTDADCVGCSGDAKKCHVPVNGGHGYCGPEAAGCSDLGKGVVVLPDPWSQYTNLCSHDTDCAGVAIDLNVGKMLRDATGYDSIKDANVSYGMNVCADVQISDKLSCGVCVPCKVDSDCGTVDVDKFALDAFGPIGSLAAALLLDQVFGPNDHSIHMFCQSVAAGYGVCAPCPGLVNDCSVGNGGGSGTCDHDESTQGTPLDPACNACAAKLCPVDSYCCSTSWDATCVSEVATYCPPPCPHDECTQGDKLDASCSSCVKDVCAADSFCCDSKWDSFCISEAQSTCNKCN